MFKAVVMGAFLSLLLVTASLAKDAPAIVENWHSPDPVPGKNNDFRKLIVIAITDDQEIRHHFEDKFVSHLRSYKIEGVTSHSLVADLQTIEHRDALLTRIADENIDGAISIRLIPLDKTDKGAWSEHWATEKGKDYSLRMLIEETLPVETNSARRFGLDVAIWESGNWYRVWAGRTDGHKMKQLEEHSGDFIEYTISVLNDAGLLR